MRRFLGGAGSDKAADKAGTGSRGAAAEQLAADFLVARGARIIARNVRCRGGEVDLVAELDGNMLFVEVRLRGNARFGGAAASITHAKQARIVLAAQHWLAGDGSRYANHPCRFDAILLDRLDQDAIEWLPGAFSA
ncbi:YraN family protein [Uliginosibacterium sp. H1]|uniref:YraN family protein n=1 Tax=Uliginosibacterium sp. H1 TaxID=3114757 RepID=UPI003FCD3BC8